MTSIPHPNYGRLIDAARKAGRVTVAVAHPCDRSALEGVLDATRLGLVQANGVIANAALLRSFLAYGAGFGGGVFVGAGDVNSDLRADIITAGASRVKVFDGATGGQRRPQHLRRGH